VDIERTKKKTQILQSMTLPLDKYGTSDGIRDAAEYDQLLTIDVGVNAIQSATSTSLGAAKKDLGDVQKAGVTVPPPAAPPLPSPH
jgi:hypothetical protein